MQKTVRLSLEEIEVLKNSIDFAIKQTAFTQFVLTLNPIPQAGLTVDALLEASSMLLKAKQTIGRLERSENEYD